MTIEMTEEKRRDYLKEEYFFLQNQYEDYDRRSLQIKSWISTGAIAALALAFNAEHKVGGLVVPIIVATVVVVVWYLEAYWKLFQYALADRIRIIEAYFRNDTDILIKNPDPFQVYHWWFRSFASDEPIYDYEKKIRPRPRSVRFREAAFQLFVCLPYVPILILCLIAFVVLSLAHPAK